MVPHETLEVRIREALGGGSEEARTLCIVGIPDVAKGEAIVLLTSEPIDLPALRSKLLEMGVPALWIPRVMKTLPAIPVLANGKLDLQACKNAAV